MLKFAVRNLMSRPARSLLSLMGLTVAIAGMVGLFAVKYGLEKAVNDTFRLIPGITVMQPGAPVPLFSKLPAEWEAELQAINGVSVVNAQIISRANLIEGKRSISPPRLLLGVDLPSRTRLQRDVYREKLIAGRFLGESDAGTANAVISRSIARQYQKDVGDELLVDDRKLRIVGIYDTKLALLDVVIVLDIGVVREMARFDPRSVSAFYVEKSDPDLSDEDLSQRIRETFQDRNIGRSSLSPLLQMMGIPAFDGTSGTGGGDPTAASVEVRTADDWADRLQEFSADLDIFLGIMTGIGMTIAVLSIINTMLMSVTERIIEFGILKANGWSRRDVLKLITLESGVIGILGGILGACVGWIATQALNGYWPDRVMLYAGPELLAFSALFALVLGVIGGLYPAIWAMRMMPMDAIRRG
ncbi:MAG: ABC transporter permease [Planctomycetaceae bacterium]